MTNMAAKPTPIIPTAIANPRDPYVACPLDVPVAVLEWLPVADEPLPLVPDSVGDEPPPKHQNLLHRFGGRVLPVVAAAVDVPETAAVSVPGSGPP